MDIDITPWINLILILAALALIVRLVSAVEQRVGLVKRHDADAVPTTGCDGRYNHDHR